VAANASNREAVRDAFASLLATALVGVGLPVKAVYGYQAGDFGGKSPVVLVMSNGSRRERHGVGTLLYRTYHRLLVLVFVADAISGQSWTDNDVEDRLDLIEKMIADVVADNRKTANWEHLEHDASFSSIAPALLGDGHTYKLEMINVIAEVFDG